MRSVPRSGPPQDRSQRSLAGSSAGSIEYPPSSVRVADSRPDWIARRIVLFEVPASWAACRKLKVVMVRHVPRNGAGNGALDTVNDWLMLPAGSEAWPVAGDRGGAVQDEIIPILPRDRGPKRTPRRAGTLKSRGKALLKVSLCESSF